MKCTVTYYVLFNAADKMPPLKLLIDFKIQEKYRGCSTFKLCRCVRIICADGVLGLSQICAVRVLGLSQILCC